MVLHYRQTCTVLVCALLLTACWEVPQKPPPEASFRVAPCELSTANVVEKTLCAYVTPAFFDATEPQTLLGRGFVRDEHRRDAPHVVVLSYAVWNRAFKGDPATVGRTIQLDGTNTIVLGILPKSFEVPATAEAWIPVPDTEK